MTPIEPSFELFGAVLALFAMTWWCLHWLAQWRADCLVELLDRMVADRIAPSEESLDRLLDALADAMPVWAPEAARLVRLGIGATTTRKGIALTLAQEAVRSSRSVDLLRRGKQICAETIAILHVREQIDEAEVAQEGAKPP